MHTWTELNWALTQERPQASSFKVLHSKQMRFVRRVHIHCTLPPTRESVSANAFMQWCKQQKIIIKKRTYSCILVLPELLDSYSNLQTHGKTQRKIIVFFWSAFILIKNCTLSDLAQLLSITEIKSTLTLNCSPFQPLQAGQSSRQDPIGESSNIVLYRNVSDLQQRWSTGEHLQRRLTAPNQEQSARNTGCCNWLLA